MPITMMPLYLDKQCDYPGYTESMIRSWLPLRHYAAYRVWVQKQETATVDGETFVYALDFIRFMDTLAPHVVTGVNNVE